jgi:hypothetical protein
MTDTPSRPAPQQEQAAGSCYADDDEYLSYPPLDSSPERQPAEGGDVKQCPMCEGKGQRLRNSFVDPTKDVERWCEACKGTGSLPPDVDELQATLASLRAQLAALQREHAASAAQRDARVAELVEKWRNQLRAVGGMDNGLVPVPAAGVRELLNEVLALAQPDAARAEGEQES